MRYAGQGNWKNLGRSFNHETGYRDFVFSSPFVNLGISPMTLWGETLVTVAVHLERLAKSWLVLT